MAACLYNDADHTRTVPIAPSDLSPEPHRTGFRRDYARVLHSAAFRRLQGKTQLFPGHESDFFRTRLTHSLEVAQVAKSLAIRLNATAPFLADDKIDLDLVETAALAHDLGHPPFGHNGEEALDELMRDHGGFEGNAQTLRILDKLEKRQTLFNDAGAAIPFRSGKDLRAGLNLSHRTLAAVLKYDRPIPKDSAGRSTEETNHPIKGYYRSEEELVNALRSSLRVARGERLRTLECSIMDVADDIAYSTYDLEDSFKAGFLKPLLLLSASNEVLERVADTVRRRLENGYGGRSAQNRFEAADVSDVLLDVFERVFTDALDYLPSGGDREMPDLFRVAGIAQSVASLSDELAADGYLRTGLTSDLVGRFIRGVELVPNGSNPALSTVRMERDTFLKVEVLKNFTYQSMIMSPMLAVTRYRGKQIIKEIFEAIAAEDGHMLMPADCRALHAGLDNLSDKRRVICDFIAGMTDRYAIEFYSRIKGTDPASIYAPI